MFRGGGTHWVFLATPWFFAWTQLQWRSPWFLSSERVTWVLSCPFLRNCLIKLAYFTKNWLSSYGSCWQYSLSFPCDTLVLCWFFAWTQILLKVNAVRELRESCPVRFWEVGLQSWQISKNNGWVPTLRGGGTHWVFLATPWFFAWT